MCGSGPLRGPAADFDFEVGSDDRPSMPIMGSLYPNGYVPDAETAAAAAVRRMLSNRESARRSRRRKQEHLGELETKVRPGCFLILSLSLLPHAKFPYWPSCLVTCLRRHLFRCGYVCQQALYPIPYTL